MAIQKSYNCTNCIYLKPDSKFEPYNMTCDKLHNEILYVLYDEEFYINNPETFLCNHYDPDINKLKVE